jgi:hypothetical protein
LLRACVVLVGGFLFWLLLDDPAYAAEGVPNAPEVPDVTQVPSRPAAPQIRPPRLVDVDTSPSEVERATPELGDLTEVTVPEAKTLVKAPLPAPNTTVTRPESSAGMTLGEPRAKWPADGVPAMCFDLGRALSDAVDATYDGPAGGGLPTPVPSRPASPPSVAAAAGQASAPHQVKAVLIEAPRVSAGAAYPLGMRYLDGLLSRSRRPAISPD